MERTLRFLVVEFPSEEFVMTRFTRAHPLCTVDLIAERAVPQGGGHVHPILFLAKGVAWREFHALLDELARVHEPAQVLRRDPAGLAWLCRVNIHESHLGPEGHALAQFEDRFGPPWLHVEQGVLHLRARLDPALDAERLVAQLTGFLEATGVAAQVEVRELGPTDYGVWEELLQAGAGLSQ
jgi:hypothetical protein